MLFGRRDTARATRAVLLSSEMLKARAQAGEAATQLLRLALDDSDLRSALFLEQAALCFLRLSRAPNVRKFAFYAVLAGNKYSAAELPRHTLRCFECALKVYEGRGWSLAEVRPRVPPVSLLCGCDAIDPSSHMLTFVSIRSLLGNVSCFLLVLQLLLHFSKAHTLILVHECILHSSHDFVCLRFAFFFSFLCRGLSSI